MLLTWLNNDPKSKLVSHVWSYTYTIDDKNEKCKEVEKLEREKEELKRQIKQLQQQQSN